MDSTDRRVTAAYDVLRRSVIRAHAREEWRHALQRMIETLVPTLDAERWSDAVWALADTAERCADPDHPVPADLAVTLARVRTLLIDLAPADRLVAGDAEDFAEAHQQATAALRAWAQLKG